MFTGLVEDCGTVEELTPLPQGSGQRLRISAKLFDDSIGLGESIAVDGICLTVVRARPGEIEVEAGPETMSRTGLSAIAVGSPVHLERAMRLSDRLGGHLVSGHVDGIGEVKESAARGDNWDVRIGCSSDLLRYIIEKGAITIDGISLTVNAVSEHDFSISLVPYTQQKVHLHKKRAGERVNLEVDLIGKYVEKLLLPHAKAARETSGLTLEKLKENGFA